MRAKFYVGCGGLLREVFKSEFKPTVETHGKLYNAVIGPFRTKRGAMFMAYLGRGNPHCVTVGQAEKLGKKFSNEMGIV